MRTTPCLIVKRIEDAVLAIFFFNAYQLTVPFSFSAICAPCFRNASTSAALPALGFNGTYNASFATTCFLQTRRR